MHLYCYLDFESYENFIKCDGMILLDNIIFELQKAGGVSLVWKHVIEACLLRSNLEFKALDSGKGYNNIFYPKGLCAEHLIEDRSKKILRRYRDVSCLGNFEVFHSSYFRVHSSPLVKNVVTVHDFIYEKYYSGIKKVIHLQQKNHALKNASAVICVSNNTKNDLLEYHPWIDEEKVHVIYNGVDPQFHEARTVAFKDIFKNPYIMFIGRREVYKNFQYALDLLETKAARDLDLTLKVVGGGMFTRSEQEYLLEKGLSKRVQIVAYPSDKELRSLYASAFAFIYPSFYEGFGIPPLEAMAVGCPVICSNTSSIPEVVGNAGLYIDPRSLSQGEQYLMKLCDADFRQKVIDQGVDQSFRFSWDETGSNTIALYENLLGQE